MTSGQTDSSDDDDNPMMRRLKQNKPKKAQKVVEVTQ